MSQHIDWETVDARIDKKMKLVSQLSRLQAHVDFSKVIFVVIVTVLVFNTGLIFNMNSTLSTLSVDVSILQENYTIMQADVKNLQDDMVLVKRKLEIE